MDLGINLKIARIDLLWEVVGEGVEGHSISLYTHTHVDTSVPINRGWGVGNAPDNQESQGESWLFSSQPSRGANHLAF